LEVYHGRSRPWSRYFIASSHNTYLMVNQISLASSREAYARCFRIGCRSVELDCSDGKPFIYHGLNMNSKIKFLDVMKTLKGACLRDQWKEGRCSSRTNQDGVSGEEVLLDWLDFI
jgi:hypothetical protein